MPNLKLIFNFLDVTFSSFWALIMVDILPFMHTIPVLKSVDETIKLLMSFAGLVYFAFRIFFYSRHQTLDMNIKKEELKKLKRENDEEDLGYN